MNYSSRLSAVFPAHHGNYGSKEEYFSLGSADSTEPFVRYTEDPTRPPSAARLEVPGDHPKDGVHNGRLCASTPFIYCKVTDADSEKVVDEMAFQKLKEHCVECCDEDPGSCELSSAGLEVQGTLNNAEPEIKKLENERSMNDHLVIPTCVDRFDFVEPVARYVKDPFTRNGTSQQISARKRCKWQKDIESFDTFEQIEPDKNDNANEDVFLALNPTCQENTAVPATESGKENYENYENLNTLHPSIVVCTPMQDSSCSYSFLTMKSLEQSSNICTSEGRALSKQSSPSISGSRLSYFSYLGEDFHKSWSRSSASSTSFTNSAHGIPRMISESSYADSSPRYSSNAPSPSCLHLQLAAEFDDGPDKLDRVIDYCSCMCCIKAMLYHCTKDDDCDSTCGEPCQCEQPSNQCLKKWGFLSVLACCMPCLLFYAPLKGLQKTAKRIKRVFRRKSVSR